MCNQLIHAFLHTCHTNGKGVYLWTLHTCGVYYGFLVPHLLVDTHNSKLGMHHMTVDFLGLLDRTNIVSAQAALLILFRS